jgi:hypothetical protein
MKFWDLRPCRWCLKLTKLRCAQCKRPVCTGHSCLLSGRISRGSRRFLLRGFQVVVCTQCVPAYRGQEK